jgi:uroporphyrin-III C-methyltransferase
MTGTTKSHKLSSDVTLAAKSSATIVILMGMHKLDEIVKIFSKENKENTPVAIIQDGTTENEKFGFGTISTIRKVVEEQQLSTPAIIVIGEVVKERVVLSSLYKDVKENIAKR